MDARMTMWRRIVWGAAIAVGVYSCATPAEPLPNNQDDPPPPPPTPTVATVDVAGVSAALSSLGETVQLTATAKDAGGATVSKSFTWLSSDDAVATVSSSGLVTAVGNGTATITASVDGKDGTTDVTVAQVATKLAFTTDPSDAGEGQTMSPVSVTARDARDNTVTGYTADVTVAFGTNPASASLGGTTTVAAGGGVATFSDLTVDKEGSGYTLEASASTLTSSTSASFDIVGPAPQGAWSGVTAGWLFTCGNQHGNGFCWGTNGNGRLGVDATLLNATVPAALATIQNVQMIEVGRDHGCAVTTSGEAYCWGNNLNGRLGDGTTAPVSAIPVKVNSLEMFASVSAGGVFSCALTKGGETYCWGSGEKGQFGTGQKEIGTNSTPLLGAGGARYESVVTGVFFTCWLDSNGGAYCAGFNRDGQIGDGTQTDRSGPTAVSGGHSFDMITAGSAHACGIENGAVLCWGSNDLGALGSAVGQVSTSPVPVAGLSNMVRVSAGFRYTCALAADGTASCWGANDTGQLGDGTNAKSTAPVAVQGGHKFAEISAGSGHTCGLTKGGDLWCWGWNFWGALGDDTRNDSNAPVRVKDPT